MDKNKIKEHLIKTFILKEETTPGISVTKAVQDKSKTINKKGVADIEKEVTSYDKASKKEAEGTKQMPQNKFNYNDKPDNEKEYHDQMEILNGQEMIRYDRMNPEFQKRAKESIEGSTRMGNKGGKETGNAEETWGASSDNFGKDLVKRIKASTKKRADAEDKFTGIGDDIEIDPSKAKTVDHSPRKANSSINENVGNQGVSEKTQGILTKWINELGTRQAAIKLIDNFLVKATGMSSSDLTDSVTFANGLDEVESYLEGGDFGGAIDATKETVRDMLEDEGYPMMENIHNTAQMGGVTNSKGVAGYNPDTSKQDAEYAESNKQFRKDMEARKYGTGDKRNPNPEGEGGGADLQRENNNKHNPKIKESMKRLKFKKEFNGVGNALKLIPESYRIDKKEFEMTDGVEAYKIRWEGTLNEGRAVILTATDKNLVTEDIARMKALYKYKSEDTLGLMKGKDRITENASFSDILAKTKRLLGESEDIEDEDAKEGDADDAVKSAPEAKKHIEGSVSTDKGTQAPKPKNGEWEEIKKNAGASPGELGSTTYAPAPKTGEWDKINVPQAAEAKKHVHMGEGVVLGGILYEPIVLKK